MKMTEKNYDEFLYHNNPPCPRCKKEMHVSVLSGGSDPTGHTNEYFCEWCPRGLNIRVIIQCRNPFEIERIAKNKKFERKHPIICQQHFKYWLQNLLRQMRKETKQLWFLPVRKN